MKRIIAGAALALPLAIAFLPSQASAFEVIINPHVHHERRWVAGHWEHRHGRSRMDSWSL